MPRRITATVTSTGSDLADVLRRAASQFDAFFGEDEWLLADVRAEPLAATIGVETVVEVWTAEVTAEADENG